VTLFSAHVKRLVVALGTVLLLCTNLTNASAENRLELRSQLKNFDATFTLQQKASSATGSLAPGKTEVKIDMGKVLAQFESSMKISEEDEYGNLYSEVCRVSPRNKEFLPDGITPAATGHLFTARAIIEISDQPEFIRDYAQTYYQVDLSVALDPSGKDFLNLNYPASVFVANEVSEKLLPSKYISRSPVGGYSFAPTTFSINTLGTLYIKTLVEFTQSIGTANCSNSSLASSRGFMPVRTSEKIEEIEVSKLNQVIQNTKLSDLPLTSKISRLKFNASSGLLVTAVEVDSNICIVDKDLVYLLKPGKCAINLSQPGDDAYEAAPDLSVAFTILGSGRESKITCVKGKVSKVVSGSKPVCPAGFKKK
jgi:hypothetical protein